MMNQEIISVRLLLISSLVSVLFLIYVLILHNIKGNYYISFCNKENKINVFIKLNGKDYLINPIGKKEVQECLGNYLTYYDRTLDVIVSNNEDMINELTSRYTVGQIVSAKDIRINAISISLGKNIILKANEKTMIVSQNPLKGITKELMQSNDVIVVKPYVEDSISRLQILNMKTIYNLKKNQLINLNLNLF